jgi:MFS family permease
VGSSSSLAGRHADLLRRAPAFRLLFLATLGSGLGTMLAVIALMVDVFDRTGSGTWVAALLIADFLPMLAVGLLLGPVVDRFSRRRVMVVSDLVRCAAFVALPFAPGPHAIVALAAVVGLAAGLFRPAVYAGLPRLVSERDLPHANALFGGVESATWMLGPLAGGILLSVAGPSLPYAINAVTFLVSAALLLRIPADRLSAGLSVSEGHWRDLAAGFRAVRASRALVTVLVAWTVVAIGSGAVNVAEIALAKVTFGAGDFGLGVLMATAGLGLTLGSFSAGAWIERRPVAHVYGGAIAAMAVAIALAAASPTIWAAAVLLVAFGFGNGVASVCNPLFVQRGAPDHLRGRAFTVVMSVNVAVLGLAMAVAGPATDAFGARWVWAGAGVAFATAGVVGFLLARGAGVDELPEPAPLPEGLPQLAGGAPQAAERLR